MQAYRFETEILPTGIIPLPKEYRSLKARKMEIIMIEKEDSKTTVAEDKRLFWDSFGGWQDERSAEEIIEDIYKTRMSSRKEIRL